MLPALGRARGRRARSCRPSQKGQILWQGLSAK